MLGFPPKIGKNQSDLHARDPDQGFHRFELQVSGAANARQLDLIPILTNRRRSIFCATLITSEDTLVSPEAIINSSPSEAELYIDPKFTAFSLNSLPPGEFLKTMGAIGTRYYGESAALDIQVDTFRSWLPFKKIDGGWKLSLDETEILEQVTSGCYSAVTFITDPFLQDYDSGRMDA